MAKKKTDESPSPYRRSSTSADVSYASQVRWEPPVYSALREASSLTRTSMNFIANQAVAQFLASPEMRSQIDAARAAQDAAIQKLGG